MTFKVDVSKPQVDGQTVKCLFMFMFLLFYKLEIRLINFEILNHRDVMLQMEK